MEVAEHCITCGVRLVGQKSTSLPCPECGKVIIGRCIHCKDQSTIYTCPECGFEGP